MRNPYIPIAAFLIILLIGLLPFTTDAINSVQPGWHATIYPDYFVIATGLITSLLFLIIGYWLVLRKAGKISMAMFFFHFLSSIAAMAYIMYPVIFMNIQRSGQAEIFNEIQLRTRLIPLAWILFISGQLVFLVYFIRTIRKKTKFPATN
jgi:hypothetical protein